MQVDQSVNSIVDHIATKLQVPSHELVRIMSRQSLVEGWVQIGFSILALIIVTIVTKYIFTVYKKDEQKKEIRKSEVRDYYSCLDGHEGMIIFGSILCLIITLLAFLSLADGITKVANPEFYIINQIVTVISGGK